MKAREWLERGRLASSPIDALRDFWTGFNNLDNSPAKCNERCKIRTFLTESISSVASGEVLAANRAVIDYLLSQPVIDMRGNGKDTAEYVKAFHAAGDPLEKLVNVFMVIYQVRCNLDHGQKSPSRERDVQLCACSAPVVAAVVQRCA
jgi:hypothetical protein